MTRAEKFFWAGLATGVSLGMLLGVTMMWAA